MNARGHLGTELINKAETTVSITRESANKEVSRVEAAYTRDLEFAPFAFMVNDLGLPEIVQGWKKKSDDRPRNAKPSPVEMDTFIHFKILQKLKEKVSNEVPTRSDLLTYLQLT